MTPGIPAFDQAPTRQKIAFWLAVSDFLATSIWLSIRGYFAILGDLEGDRKFVTDPRVLQLLPVVILIWIISFVIVGNSITQSRRPTSYGIWALVFLAFPATPVIVVIGKNYWSFFATP